MRISLFRRRRLRRALTMSIAVLAGTAAAGVAASIPDASGVIHSCYRKNGGNLRVVDPSTGRCLPSEIALSWNQTGPTGPRGSTGSPGPTGPKGTTGPQGPGVKTIAGLVNADGSIEEGSGFTVIHTGTGSYLVDFPSGTWTGGCVYPVLTVQPVSGIQVTTRTAQQGCGNEGGGTTQILLETVGGSPAPTDRGFMFIAAQP